MGRGMREREGEREGGGGGKRYGTETVRRGSCMGERQRKRGKRGGGGGVEIEKIC